MMMRILLLGVVQSLLLCGGQVLLKFALLRMGNFTWTLDCFVRNLTNWWLLGCGLCYACATALWLYIVRTFPFSMAYPMISLSYVFGMFRHTILQRNSTPHSVGGRAADSPWLLARGQVTKKPQKCYSVVKYVYI